MALILLEAFGAAALLIFIVWWTMFSGRRGGEPAGTGEEDAEDPADGISGGAVQTGAQATAANIPPGSGDGGGPAREAPPR